MTARYGGERIRKGLSRFVLGKGLSSVFGLLTMFVVVRALTVSDFARYSVLVALIEVFSAVSGFGFAHVINRYVPELYVKARLRALRDLIGFAIFVRLIVLVFLLSLVFYFSLYVASWIGLEEVEDAFRVFLIVVFFRSLGHHLTLVLESTLHQGISQIAYTSSALLKLVGVFLIGYFSSLDLRAIIFLEAVCDALSALILLGGIVSVFGDKSKLERNSFRGDERRQIFGFAVSAYLQHLATLPFGGNTNRLVGGAMFGDSIMAGFGFSQTLYEYFKRYLPTQFLVGFIRPVVISRYVSYADFSSAARLCDQSVQINLTLLSGVLAVLYVVGTDVLLLLSGGKYGSESVALLFVMLVLLGLETYRVVLELLAQTVERYDILIFGNVLLSISVLGGVVGFKYIGAIAFPVSNAVVLFFVNLWVVKRLSVLGCIYQSDWRDICITFLMFAFPAFCGELFKYMFDVHWGFSGLVTVFVYGAFFYRFRLKSSKCFFGELVGGSQK